MAILDNRTSLEAYDNTLATGDYLATSSAAVDTEVFYQGDRSIAENMNNSTRAVVYNFGSPQNFSNNIFYLLINCGVVSNLLSKSAGGFRIRFCGGANEAANFFEVYVGGNDSWPSSFIGGWTMFIVDIETARADAITNGWTNGTVPATSAIQCVGYAGETSTMIRTADNTWWNGFWRLPANTPGIIVEEQNTGSVDWTFADILSTAQTNFWGSFRSSDGGAYVCNVPIQIGNTTGSLTHGFSDTNQTLLWETPEFFADGRYGISIVGAATSTTTVTLGIKTGTGDDATGAQGVLIQSDATQNTRWFLDASDANVTFNAYGCTFNHGETFTITGDAEVISTTMINSSSYVQSTSATDGSIYLRNSVINAATADGVAFVKTVDMTDIKYSLFEFSDGHAIELTTPRTASQISLGNTFSGYGATGSPATNTDAAVYNNTAGAVTISVTSGDAPSYRNGTSASTVVTASAAFTVKNVIAGSEVRFIDLASPVTELAGVENIGLSPEGLSNVTTAADTENPGNFTVTYTYDQADAPISTSIKVLSLAYQIEEVDVTLGTSGGELLVQQRLDRNYDNPP